MNEHELSRRALALLLGAAMGAPRSVLAQERDDPEEAIVAWLQEGGGTETIETADDPFSRMTAPISINGRDAHYFVVDTGANQSVISVELAAELGLRPGPSIQLNGVAGLSTTPTVVADSMVIGDSRIIDHNVLLAVLPQEAIGAPGILGVDRFRKRRITMDFKDRRLIVDPPYRRSIPFSVRVPAVKRSGQLMIVKADLAGIKLSAFLDSGAERTIGNPALLQLATVRRPTTQFFDVPVVSVTGATLPGRIAMLPVLRLGGVSLANIVITFADLHIFRIWNLRGPSVLVGVDAMSAFDAVTLDFGRSEVVFQMRPDQMGPPKIGLRPGSDTRIPRKTN